MTKTNRTIDTQPIPLARVAGLLYLIIIVSGIGAELWVRGQLIVPADAATTLVNIRSSKPLFMVGFVADSVMLTADVALAVLLYVLFKTVDATLALIAMVFRLMQAAILGANLLYYLAVPVVLNGDAADTQETSARIMLFLDLHSSGYDLGLVFFAVSNLALGYLVIRSHLPTALGYGLQAAAVVYLVGSYTRFLTPQYLDTVQPAYFIPLLAEGAFCLWLLARGIDNNPPTRSHITQEAENYAQDR